MGKLICGCGNDKWIEGHATMLLVNPPIVKRPFVCTLCGAVWTLTRTEHKEPDIKEVYVMPDEQVHFGEI